MPAVAGAVIVDMVVALIDAALELARRARQSGALTPEQETALRAKADALFELYEDAPPPGRPE